MTDQYTNVEGWNEEVYDELVAEMEDLINEDSIANRERIEEIEEELEELEGKCGPMTPAIEG